MTNEKPSRFAKQSRNLILGAGYENFKNSFMATTGHDCSIMHLSSDFIGCGFTHCHSLSRPLSTFMIEDHVIAALISWRRQEENECHLHARIFKTLCLLKIGTRNIIASAF